MPPGVLDEYMIKLGAAVDATGMNKFHSALKEASAIVDSKAAKMTSSFVGAQTKITGGFAAIGLAALGMAEKVAQADQSYRLFGLHMYMSQKAAMGLKVAMDALGQPLENLMWDQELRRRTSILLRDQRIMQGGEPNDSEAQLERIRDIRFQLTRMEVEFEYLSRGVVIDFLNKVGVGPVTLLDKLKSINAWITHNLPGIANKVSNWFLPVWKDVKSVFTGLVKELEDASVAFTNIVGLFSGDSSIMGTTFSLEKLAGALQHVVNGFTYILQAMEGVGDIVMHLASALALLGQGKFTGAAKEVGAALKDVNLKVVGGVVGGTAAGFLGSAAGGAALGSVFGPVGTVVGAGLGGLVGFSSGFGIGAAAGGAASSGKPGAPANPSWRQALLEASAATGIPPDLIWSQWAFETGGFTHLAGKNNVAGIRFPGSKQFRNFASPEEFAQAYINVMNSKRYAGIGTSRSPAQFVAYLHRGGYFGNDSAATYLAGVQRYDREYRGSGGDVNIGTMQINVTKPGATNEDVGRVVQAKIQETRNKRIQRNLLEFQSTGWAY